jgi:hypothetical protein
MDKLSVLGTGLGTTAETRIDTSTNTYEINDKNQIKEHYIYSQSFHQIFGGRVQKITVEERFKSRILKFFDPANQKLYQLLPTTIHTQMKPSSEINRREDRSCARARRQEHRQAGKQEQTSWKAKPLSGAQLARTEEK